MYSTALSVSLVAVSHGGGDVILVAICYTRNGVKKSLLSLTEKITTPSIKMVGPGGTFYTPLFTGNTGNTRDIGKWRYKLSGFTVGSYHAAESRAWINSPPTITGWVFVDNDHQDLILRSIAPGIEFTQRMLVSDPDQYDFQCDAYLTTNYDGGSSWTRQYNTQQISNSNITVYSGIECSPYIRVVCNNGEGLTSKLRINATVTDGYDSTTGAKEVTISRHENCLYLVDRDTRYTGEVWRAYGINKLTGIYGHGLPYLEVVGLPSSWVGKNVYYRIVQDSVTSFVSRDKFPDLNFEGLSSIAYRIDGTVYVNNTDNFGSGVRLCNGQNPVDADLKRDPNNTGFQPNYHGWVHLGTGFLPYGKFTIVFYYVDNSKIVDVQCCHVSNACTGHGSLPILSGKRNSWINGDPYT